MPLDQRERLAQAWRVLGLLGHTDAIFNHISKSWFDDGGRQLMAMNPGNKFAADVTPGDIQVFPVESVDLPAEAIVNLDGFELHREIHRSRGRPGVALHTHAPYIAAVSAMEVGLLPLSQAAFEFVNDLKYLRYDGRFRDGAFSDELRTFVQVGGFAILQNHGDLIIGESVEEVVYLAYYLEEACRIQCIAMATGKSLHTPNKMVTTNAGDSLARDRPLLASVFFEALCERLGVER